MLRLPLATMLRRPQDMMPQRSRDDAPAAPGDDAAAIPGGDVPVILGNELWRSQPIILRRSQMMMLKAIPGDDAPETADNITPATPGGDAPVISDDDSSGIPGDDTPTISGDDASAMPGCSSDARMLQRCQDAPVIPGDTLDSLATPGDDILAAPRELLCSSEPRS